MLSRCSEAILLGGLAMKRNWQNRRKKEGKPIDKPNIVMGSEIHVRGLCCSMLPDCTPQVMHARVSVQTFLIG